jgi:general nucleoside transport system permease protein
MTGTEAAILTIITASTPLLLAAIGELVVERSGVLNLGIEGMMVMGAVCGFGAATLTGSAWLGVGAGILGGAFMALLFGFLTQTMVTNQVATGLAITLLGLGLSGLIGSPFVGLPLKAKMTAVHIPFLSDLPFVGKIIFGQDPLVYISVALVVFVSHVLFKTRVGLIIRAVGQSHNSAHALGFPVVRIRYACIVFGGACSGLAGAYLSLSYTPQWIENMTAGRGWIALALVVFSTWIPFRLAVGAYLFGTVWILGLYVQAMGIAIPPQLLTSLPYVSTIVALSLISRNKRLSVVNTPADLGKGFVADR